MKTNTKIVLASVVALGLTGASLAYATQKQKIETDLTLDQVSEIALAAQPGTIEEIELEMEDGIAVFEVEIETPTGEVEVLIDATNGEVLSVENEESDDDDDENTKDKT